MTYGLPFAGRTDLVDLARPEPPTTEGNVMIRVGIVGTNTSHAGVYAGLINGRDPSLSATLDARVVGVWSSGRTGLSGDHSDAGTLARQYRIDKVVSEPQELIGLIDLVLILDDFEGGALHAELAGPFLEAGIATYIDKPITVSIDDALALFGAAERSNAPLMSCSALRFSSQLARLRADAVGPLRLVSAVGPGDWFNYGVHTVESLVTLLGPGATSVQQFAGQGRDLTVITGPDGPRAVVATLRDAPTGFQLVAHGTAGSAQIEINDYDDFYGNTIRAAVAMAASGKAPIDAGETLEVLAILVAGERSAQSGHEVVLSDVLAGAAR
jgi:predicted dehydrogenase